EREDWPRSFLAYGRSMAPVPTAPAAGARGAGGAARPPAATAMGALSSHQLDGVPAVALAEAREALDHDLDDLLLHPAALPAALSVLVGCGHQAEAFARRRALVDDLDRLPRWVRAEVELAEAAGHYAAGDLQAARHVLTERLSDLPAHAGHGYGRFRTRLVGLLANVQLDLGDPAGAEALLRRHHHEGHVPPAWYDADVPLARARLRVRAGELTEGAEEL
ncbi:helix-turn-helix transcriptional regulator, partial [Nocardiopsis tropica]|nr:helix-turn-helix transcriptional regulator [Nocardiopsis tropica]